MRNARIFAVDDEPEITDLLSEIFEAIGGNTCATTNDPDTAFAELLAFRPDVVILDVMLGAVTTGFDLCRKIRAHDVSAHVGILVLSGVIHRGASEEGVFSAGADNFMSKAELSPALLECRVRALLRRCQVARDDIHVGPLRVSQSRGYVELEGRPLWLSATEHSMIVAMAGDPTAVFTPEDLVPRGGNRGRAKFHIHNLRKKFGRHARMIQTVRGAGYRLRPEALGSPVKKG